MSEQERKGRVIRQDLEAKSASSSEPAFITRPVDAPVYHGFAILESSEIDGWKLGVISDPNDAAGCEDLDGFVVAPDNSRAGLVWDSNLTSIATICAPTPDRWGVYGVPMSAPVHNDAELIAEFHKLLPILKKLKAVANGA